MTSGPIALLPLWALGPVILIAVLLAMEGGFRVGQRRRRTAELEPEGPVNSMVSSSFGLLAFLLAFTFSLAASYFENRRSLVLAEANAIGTTFLRAQMLPEPEGKEIRGLLRDYVRVRLDAVESGQIEHGLLRSGELQQEIWLRAVSVGHQNPNSIVVGLFIQSLNETIDLHAKRVAAGLRIHIPRTIWDVLLFMMLVAMTAQGYQEGLVGQRRSYVTLALACSFSAVMFLIADLDRTQEGFLRVSQQPLLDLLDTMKTAR